MASGQTEYACTLKGVALFALDRWKAARDEHHNSPHDIDRLIATGRCRAYSSVLRQITGIPAGLDCVERWEQSIKTMV